MTAHHISTMRELDSRTNDRLHVRLLWASDDGRIAVVVDDGKTGEQLAFDVPDREKLVPNWYPVARTARPCNQQTLGFAGSS